MRPIARLLTPILAAAAIALAGGAPAVQAASEQSAQPRVYDLHDAWCFDDAPGYLYCFEIDGKAHFQDNQNGESLVVNQRMHTVVYDDGVQVGESTEITLLRGVYQADGTVTTHQVVNARSESYGETCHYQGVYRMADYELIVDNAHFHCAG